MSEKEPKSRPEETELSELDSLRGLKDLVPDAKKRWSLTKEEQEAILKKEAERLASLKRNSAFNEMPPASQSD